MSTALAGCTVVVTREHRGELGRLLAAAGAVVEHVPLIEIAAVDAAQRDRLERAICDEPDWLVVTSAAGADRVGAVSRYPAIGLAAVGTATASRLAEVAERPVDVLPDRQIASSLIDAFVKRVEPAQRVVLAQADLAGDELARGLEAAGHSVDVHVAYRTLVRVPSDEDRRRVERADAVVFASGSSARAWADALGDDASAALPPIVAVIGPTTRAAAEKSGLKITNEAAEHSLAGIVEELVNAWRNRVG